MKTQHYLKRRRAGSQILAAAILVGIAISAAGVYASGIIDQISTVTQNSRLSVQEIRIIQDDDEREWFAATIKNEGDAVINQINITIQSHNLTETYSITKNVKPGRTVVQELVEILDSAGKSPTLNVGQSIPIEIQATATDGSVFNEIESVRIT